MFNDISGKPNFGKGVRVFEVSADTINTLYHNGYVNIDTKVYPNQPLILKAGQQSALVIVAPSGLTGTLVNQNSGFFGIKARNTEQLFLMNMLSNPMIRLLVITGAAGTGKTLCIGSHALDAVLKEQKYKKLILSKPLETVGRGRFLGTVPGTMEEKFHPFLMSYMGMFDTLMGEKGQSYLKTALSNKVIEFVPLELMRGISMRSSLAWFDEAQSIGSYEMETLGSRIDDTGESKLILSGDLNQRDRDIAKKDTGLYKLVDSQPFMDSPYTASIHLVENERGVISQLFYEVFSKKEDEY